jgi:hypothetical protein
MTRSTRLPKVSVLLAALVAVLTLASQTAEAQVKPFKVTGGGFVPQGIPVVPNVAATHTAVGQATELGRYSAVGQFQLLKFTSPTTADFDSAVPCVFQAANGDKLAFTYGDTGNGAKQSGKVQLFPAAGAKVYAIFVAEFNPVPASSTGRFRNVSGGSFIMTAVTQPFVLGSTAPVAYTWSGDGWIQYAQGGDPNKKR